MLFCNSYLFAINKPEFNENFNDEALQRCTRTCAHSKSVLSERFKGTVWNRETTAWRRTLNVNKRKHIIATLKTNKAGFGTSLNMENSWRSQRRRHEILAWLRLCPFSAHKPHFNAHKTSPL